MSPAILPLRAVLGRRASLSFAPECRKSGTRRLRAERFGTAEQQRAENAGLSVHAKWNAKCASQSWRVTAMNETLDFLANHGYWLLVAAVLGRQACLPVPANALLVAAGALAHSGRLSLPLVVCISVVTFLLADLAWYEAGRRKGERVLHFLYGLSSGTESCVHRATNAFASHGVRTLLFSKFVVGLDAVAAPLTGATHVGPVQFVVFDGLGAMFWSASYVALGYIFSTQLDQVAVHLARIGTFVAIAVATGFGYYLVRRFARPAHA